MKINLTTGTGERFLVDTEIRAFLPDDTPLEVVKGAAVFAEVPAQTEPQPERRDGAVAKRRLLGVVKAAEGDVVEGFASYRSVDRHNELVLPSAFLSQVEAFMRHPVMLLGHEPDPAVELPIGRFTALDVKPDGLYVKGELLKEHRRYQEVRAAFRKGLLAWSIGFLPKAWREPSEDEVREHGQNIRLVYTEVELLEISGVSIPANRDTLAELRALAFRCAKQDVEAAEWASIVAELRGLRDLVGTLDPEARIEALRTSLRTFVEDFAGKLDDLGSALDKAGTPLRESPHSPPALVVEGLRGFKPNLSGPLPRDGTDATP